MEWIDELKNIGAQISIDGKGPSVDNLVVE